MRNALLGLVTHVGETKCLAFDLAIAAVDDEMMLVAQVARQLRHINAAIVLHTGQRDRPEIFFGEKLEAASLNPVLNKRVATLVAREAVLQSFGKYFVELRLQRVNMTDTRSTRRHEFALLFFEFEKIEIITAIFVFRRA